MSITEVKTASRAGHVANNVLRHCELVYARFLGTLCMVGVVLSFMFILCVMCSNKFIIYAIRLVINVTCTVLVVVLKA